MMTLIVVTIREQGRPIWTGFLLTLLPLIRITPLRTSLVLNLKPPGITNIGARS